MHYLALVATVLLGSNASPGDAPSLVGSWTLPQGDGVTSFVFSKDGTCIFANKPKKDEKVVEESGKYAVESDKLTITLEDRTLVFQFSLQDGRLTLSGGKLPKEGATFSKDETIDFRKLVGNWEAKIPGGAKVYRDGEFKVPGSSSKVYRFRGDGTFSNDDLDDEGLITNTTAGRYSIGEDNTITFKVGDLPEAVFKIKLMENSLTLRGGSFPPDGRTFVRKKEKGAKTGGAVTKDPKTEDKKADPAKLPGDAVWELSELKSPFRILKTTYDPEAREVVWTLESRRDITFSAPRIYFKFYDADEVRLATVQMEYRPKFDTTLPKGERIRGVLVLPSEDNVQDMKKVVASDKQ